MVSSSIGATSEKSAPESLCSTFISTACSFARLATTFATHGVDGHKTGMLMQPAAEHHVVAEASVPGGPDPQRQFGPRLPPDAYRPRPAGALSNRPGQRSESTSSRKAASEPFRRYSASKLLAVRHVQYTSKDPPKGKTEQIISTSSGGEVSKRLKPPLGKSISTAPISAGISQPGYGDNIRVTVKSGCRQGHRPNVVIKAGGRNQEVAIAGQTHEEIVAFGFVEGIRPGRSTVGGFFDDTITRDINRAIDTSPPLEATR